MNTVRFLATWLMMNSATSSVTASSVTRRFTTPVGVNTISRFSMLAPWSVTNTKGTAGGVPAVPIRSDVVEA